MGTQIGTWNTITTERKKDAMKRNNSKTAGTFLVALTGLLGALVLVAGPAGAMHDHDHTGVHSGDAVAKDNSVASGSAVAIDDSTASGDAVAIGGSVASGCSTAIDDSTASGGGPHCGREVVKKTPPPVVVHEQPRAAHHHQPQAVGVPARSLAVTGPEVGPLSVAAAAAVLLGMALMALTADKRRRAEASS